MSTPIEADLSGGLPLSEFLRLAPEEGLNESLWPGLAIFRADKPATRIPVVYEPCICVVAHGRKQVHIGDEVISYDPLHYLVVGVPLPVEAEIVEASKEAPFLSLRLNIDIPMLSELLLDAKPEPGPDDAARAIYASRMNSSLSGAVSRLLKSLHNTSDSRVLAPLAIRELLYHILIGEQGERLRSVAMRDSRANRIAAVLRYLHKHSSQPLSVEELAKRASMSVSTFHHNFKSMTSLPPLQYLKMIRLHQARLLMLNDGLGAGEAAYSVGYNSASQFTREFRRVFGAPPAREIKRLQNSSTESGRSVTDAMNA
ncbi:MAG: AraC family transcriptional regulator [Pseudomonadota bacterium]